MPTFAFRNIESIRCTIVTFKKLVRNGKCFLDEFEEEIKDNPKYKSEYKTILSYIELYSNSALLPKSKFREIKGKKPKQYEFKSKNLRIYAVQVENEKIIVIGGYKNTQTKDFNRLDVISKELKGAQWKEMN